MSVCYFSKRKLDIEVEDEDDDDIGSSRRRIRTPSPVREDVGLLRNQIASLKETFGDIARNPAAVIPDALKLMYAHKQYVDGQIITQEAGECGEPNTKEQASNFVEKVASRLIESIAVSNTGSYMLITQAEAYLRDSPSIDDCANSTITIGYPENLVFVVEQKREYSNQWFEAKIYYKKFEFLVTGCLNGRYDNNAIQAFLGASLGKKFELNGYWRVYIPLEAVKCIKHARLLRNFTKNASGLKWLLKSERFHSNGFSTACPLNLHATVNINSIVAAGSLLLKMKAENMNIQQELVKVLKRSDELKSLDFEHPAAKKNERKRSSLKLSKGKMLAVEITLTVLRGGIVANAKYIELFKSLISSRMKTLNNRAIKEKKYLC
ncbi:hypothetical protein G6F46_012636 [Rhizopus delemar]|uniref:Uncharacterized protein n=3 Tax=Rhizopus TaxID=4842 RepID=I1BMK3_RHIO9|nr:hypothetical protein RO3G_02137 [Rhizopus delemar RA 99-880]KAG1171386.1 hypothetical protein G6F36_011762 [Rhizopus arrhizus]KAG1447038.1 hypothetical protein G6F55_011287 [Rhizopus delemar]KAG1489484.1 hypothetical protein G6F54_011403 [Rhizopus delemar]KAG1499379.1 hypothetical protein G6F53_011533 [Rhizopus delemar]|eukprot:EIE77433.1 hypothetical protein RO3G_02137 [Rhizopus delemar RA 99-880]